MNDLVPSYQPGDRIAYRVHDGSVRIVDVTYRRVADFNGGRSGFDGTLVASTHLSDWPGLQVWGYDDQIVPVLP